MSTQPEWVFEAADYEGTPIVLSRATWHAKAGNDEPGIHPEVEIGQMLAAAESLLHLLAEQD